MYENYCRIWVERLNTDTIDKIMAIVKKSNLDYDEHNKSVTVYTPTYDFLYAVNNIDYIILF